MLLLCTRTERKNLSDRLKYFGEARGRASSTGAGALVRVSGEGEGEGSDGGCSVSLLGLGKRGKVSIYTSGG